MRRAALIYNPASGRQRERRLADVEAAAAVFRAAGMATDLVATSAAGSAGEQARQAIASGCDLVLACGGDGTVHDVLQGLVECGGEVPLGVIPLGTGNALANDLGLSRDAATAARAVLSGEPRRIAAGKVEFQDESAGPTLCRYFTVTAGAGLDARMLYGMNLEFKQRHGMAAYYAEAARLFVRPQFVPFEVEFTEAESGQRRREVVSQLMAVRITNFGGMLRRLAPDASLLRDDLRLVLFKTRSRWPFVLFWMNALLGRRGGVPGVELVHSREVACRPLPPAAGEAGKVYAEADGEVLGALPVRISVVPRALTLVMPGN